jgi:hypothetical protein
LREKETRRTRSTGSATTIEAKLVKKTSSALTPCLSPEKKEVLPA